MLDELYELTLKQRERELKKQENLRYMELVDTLHKNDIDIDFGIEI